MLWLLKSVIILVLVCSEIVSRKFVRYPALILILIFLFSPAFLSVGTGVVQLIMLGILSVLWILTSHVGRPAIKIFTLVAFLILGMLFVGIATGIISPQLSLDRDRLFFIDSHYPDIISGFRTRSVFLPYRFRPLVFGDWIYIPAVVGRCLTWLWPDKIVVVTGFLALIPIINGFLQSVRLRETPVLAGLFLFSLMGSLARDPNTSSVYFLALPMLIRLVGLGMVNFRIPRA